jgi:hypothetical protein
MLRQHSKGDDIVTSEQTQSSIDAFDRAIGSLEGRNGVDSTKPSTIVATTTLIGNASTFIVQTYRERSEHAEGGKPRDTIFVQHIDQSGGSRHVFPAEVADAIARQRDALTTKARKRAARAGAETRKANGFKPTPPPRRTKRTKKTKK